MSDNSDIVKPYYVREVKLWYFGESEPFGIYDRETKTITITNEQAMGKVDIPSIQVQLDSDNASDGMGSAYTFGVPRKAWELRQRSRYAHPEDFPDG